MSAGFHSQEPTAAPCDLLQQMPGVAWTADRELRFTSRGGAFLAGHPSLPADLFEERLLSFLDRSAIGA